MRYNLLTATLAVAILTSGCQRMGLGGDYQETVQGTYDAETRYDMSSFKGIFSGLASGWRQPDQLIQGQIISTIEREYGSTVSSTFASIYGPTLQREISAYLTEETPPWLMQIGPTLDVVDAQMQVVDVQNTMLLAETTEGSLKVTQIWDGIAVFKDPACPGSDVLICDQIEFGSQALLDSEYPLEIVSSDYEASEADNMLSLSSHSVDMNYGRLGLYFLTNQLLPDDPTQGIGLRDVALGAINCRGLAGRLAGGDDTYGVDVGGVNVGLSLSDLIGNCEEGVFASVNSFVDQFDVPLGMDLAGSARLLDNNRDGRVDQLTGGTVDGDMNVQLLGGQTKDGPVSGSFVGYRVGDIE